MSITHKNNRKGYAKLVRATSFLLSLLIMFSMLFVGGVDSIKASAEENVPFWKGLRITIDFSDVASWWNNDGCITGITWWNDDEHQKKLKILDVDDSLVTFEFIEDCKNFILIRTTPGSYNSSEKYYEIGSWVSGVTVKNQYPTYNSLEGSTLKITGSNSASWIGEIPAPSATNTKTVYFKDMTGYVTNIEAAFLNDSNDSESQNADIFKDSEESGLFRATVEYDPVAFPDGFSQVQFTAYDNNGQSVKTAPVTIDNNYNTYYFGATESAENAGLADEHKDFCYWYNLVLSNILNEKILYFSDEDFPLISDVDNQPTIQIGYNGEPKTLERTGSMYRYSFDGPDSDAISKKEIITITYNGKKYHFLWFDAVNNNKVTLLEGIAYVNGQYILEEETIRIYFDATLSKLQYYMSEIEKDKGTSGCNYNMPSSESGRIECCWYDDGEKSVTMTRDLTNPEIYYVDIPGSARDKDIYFKNEGCTEEQGKRGARTRSYSIPVGLTNPCFYADSSDPVIYNQHSNKIGDYRDGYWGGLNRIRDAEYGKTINDNGKECDVVDIKQSKFQRRADALYVDTTFYDYYTDYELNGNNRDDYPLDFGVNAGNRYITWYPYRQFNQALSEYYRKNNVSNALYEGHFQPNQFGYFSFGDIKDNLNLYQYGIDNSRNNYDLFMCNNNSNYNIAGAPVNVKSVVQKLASDKLSNNDIKLSDGVSMPFFNKEFIEGDNSKNTKLGEVYDSVLFPFTKKEVNNDGIEYWYFNAKDTTLAMRQDRDTNQYYLDGTPGVTKDWSRNKESDGSDHTSGHGFFPFNEGSNKDNAGTYNYGYGMKLEFKFRLTEDGKVTNSEGKEVPIEFNFTGDDDVWVYVDGNLALDMGGAHAAASGKIDFSQMKATVAEPGVKKSGNNSNPTSESTFEIVGSNTDEHTLVMYYMERGMWESNLEVSFNFPDSNEFQVEKKVDAENVNEIFKPDELFNNVTFAFDMKNLITHYGETPADGYDNVKDVKKFAENFDNYTSPNQDSGISVEKLPNKYNQTNVIQWSSTNSLENISGDELNTARENRLIKIKSDNGYSSSDSTFDYLRFMVYLESETNDSDDENAITNLDLTKMYLRLKDSSGKEVSDYLNSSLLLSVPELAGNQWGQVRVLLDEFIGNSGVDKNKITEISFQYDDAVTLYLNDFVFQPETALPPISGFTKKQSEMPSYGTAETGELSNVVGAIYSTNTNKVRTVGNDGQVYLSNNEIATFTDQFRRGSYIYLNESKTTAQNDLFSTKWTLYEVDSAGNYSPVRTNVKSDYLVNEQNLLLENIIADYIYDNRTELALPALPTGALVGEDVNIDDNKYSKVNQPDSDGNPTGKQPDGGEKTIVFRSYSTPNEIVSNNTKLKVTYTNTVNVGSLTIKKDVAEGSLPLGDDTKYQFYVKFSNVGGMALEEDPIYYGSEGSGTDLSQVLPITLKAGESHTIQGIPVGTEFEIHEVDPTNETYLKKVERKRGNESKATDITNDIENGTLKGNSTHYIEGIIKSIDGSGVSRSYTFYNYKGSRFIDYTVKKQWYAPDGTTLITPDDGTAITLKLQSTTSQNPVEGDWSDVADRAVTLEYANGGVECTSGSEYGTLKSNSEWTFTFTNLDEENSENEIIRYRVVEVTDGLAQYGYHLGHEDHNWDERTSTIQNIKNVQILPNAGTRPVINFALIGAITLILSLIAFHIYRKVHRNAIYSAKGGE